MATPSQIRTLSTARPFRPYRVRMSSGPTYLINHPEDAACGLEGRSSELVAFDDEGMHLLDMMLVEALEPVATQPATPENN